MNILIPDSWLREFLKTDASPDDIKNCLSLCGPSVDRLNKVNGDAVYEIEITTNRIDTVSVYGIAREAAAILPRFGFDAELIPLDIKTPAKPERKLPMRVSDPGKICNRIMGVVMEVEPIKESPVLIRKRIEMSGVRALNNLVDVTNYIMLELGHPSHVFDYDRIKTHEFLIRYAKKNEPIITLDQKKYLLDPQDVIIDDGTGRVIDLPGIMGTQNSVVTDNTRRIFFFIESNNPTLIRRTSMRYAIRTMAASINEKHPDPELVKTALLRGVSLYQRLAGARVSGEIIDIYPDKSAPETIKISVDFINQRLGINLAKDEIVKILSSLSFTVKSEAKSTRLTVTPPSFRQFDVSIAEDIVEEVARIYGYHNLPARLMTGEIPNPPVSNIFKLEDKIKTMLKYRGYTEIYNYSFISKEIIEKSKLKVSEHLKLANPLTPEIEYMRISLVPSMLDIVAKNQPYSSNLRLFELANVYQPQKNGLPNEFPMLIISSQENFPVLKGLVESLMSEQGIKKFKFSESTDELSTWPHFWNPNQTASVSNNGKVIGIIGKINSTLQANFQIKRDLFLAVINMELISQMANSAKKYHPVPLYPPLLEDLSLILPSKTRIGPVLDSIYAINRFVKKIDIIDRFENRTTVRITYLDPKSNLSSQKVQKIREDILTMLQKKYGISIPR